LGPQFKEHHQRCLQRCQRVIDRPDFADQNGLWAPGITAIPSRFLRAGLACNSTGALSPMKFAPDTSEQFRNSRRRNRAAYLLSLARRHLAKFPAFSRFSVYQSGRYMMLFRCISTRRRIMRNTSWVTTRCVSARTQLLSVLRLNCRGAIAQYTLGVGSQRRKSLPAYLTMPPFSLAVSAPPSAIRRIVVCVTRWHRHRRTGNFNVQNANSGFVPGIGFEQKYHYGAQIITSRISGVCRLD